MASLLISGNTSGVVTLTTPTDAGNTIITLPASSGTAVYSVTNNNGFKNRLINGNMSIWQRGTSFTPNSGQFTADRWWNRTIGAGTYTFTQSTDVPSGQGFPYSYKLQMAVGTTGTACNTVQVIESKDMIDLVGQSVTLSFWAKAGADFAGTISAIIGSGTVADQGSQSYINGSWTGANNFASSSPTLTTTWTQYTLTGTVPSNALELGIGIFWSPTGAAGADDSYYITGIQLEKSAGASSFDFRPNQVELTLCLRHLPTWNSPVLGRSTGDKIWGYASSTTTTVINIPFTVPARVATTGVITSAGGTYTLTNVANAQTGAATVASTQGGVWSHIMTITTTAGSPTLVAGNVGYLSPTTTTSSIIFTGAEL